MDRPRIEQMQLTVFSILILTVGFQRMTIQGIGWKCPGMLLLRFPRDFF